VTEYRVNVTGTTAITSFGTVANSRKLVRFTATLTLTHNATSLILPGGANITTAAGDVAEFVSDGSGNWRCVGYQKADGLPLVEIASRLGIVDVQTFSSSGTYTRSSDVTKAIIIVAGATGGGAAASSDAGNDGGSTSFGSHLSVSGGAGGTIANADMDSSRAASDGSVTGSGYSVIGHQPGGFGGAGYDGGGQWRLGQHGGGAPVAMKYVTPGATETVTIGAAGSGSSGSWEEGMDGKAGYVTVVELK
jgi:hypothetical protein